MQKLKEEPTPATSPDAEDHTILEAVMACSMNGVNPADLQMQLDTALAWTKAEWEKEEAGRQKWLLEEAALHRACCLLALDDTDVYVPPPFL
jgi:hypothetical protein